MSRPPPSGEHRAAPAAFRSIPVVDVAGLRSQDRARREAVAAEIARACEEVGFLYVRNHGVAAELVDELVAGAAAFFRLPEDVKLKYHIGFSRNHRGYVPVGEEVFSYGQAAADRKEAFDLALDLPPDDPDHVTGNPLLGPNVWPEETPALRRAATAYYSAVLALGRRMMRAFALALGLEETHFDAFLTKPTSQLRLVHYPPSEAGSDDAMGIGAHTDYECFTLLHTTEPGLQVMNAAGEWIDAPPLPGALVVNVGDLLEAWTNGRFVATSHRVLRNERERFSFPLFFAVDYGTYVAPLESCREPGREPRYPGIVAGEHLFAQTARTFRYLRRKVEAGEISIIEPVSFGREAGGAGAPSADGSASPGGTHEPQCSLAADGASDDAGAERR